MPVLWFGDDHVGDNTTTLANTWISYTMPRPVARQAMNGMRPFAIKKIGFKCCAAPSLGQKLYARVSTPDGSVFDNSYIGNTISWQKEAKVTYEFQAINFHLADDGGSKIRAWLVSGGPFLFARHSSGGTIETPGGSYGGYPIGYFQYAEVALPPEKFTIARDADDPNKVNIAWDDYDSSKAAHDDALFAKIGSTFALSGYVVQVARDPDFTKYVRLAYVSKKKGATEATSEIYGLYAGYDWYFRMSTRNEVSEKYKLPGGIWGPSQKLGKSDTAGPLPSANEGLPPGASAPASGVDTSVPGAVSANNPNATSNNGTAPNSSGGTTTPVDDAAAKAAAKAASKAAAVSQTSASMTVATDEASKEPTNTQWSAVGLHVSSISADIDYMIGLSTGDALAAWNAAKTAANTAATAVAAAATAAGSVQTNALKLDAIKQQVIRTGTLALSSIRGATGRPTVSRYQALAGYLHDLFLMAGLAAPLTTGTLQTAWQNAATALQNAENAARAAVASPTTDRVNIALALSAAATATITATNTATPAPAPAYDAARVAITALTAAIDKAVKATAKATAAAPIPSPAGSIPVTNTDGSLTYTPIPDTTAQRTAFGGLLVSTDSSQTPGHTVYLMDRGGRQRLGQFFSPTSITYNRIRDDQSLASIQLAGKAVSRNQAVLDQMAIGRHEIAIYRGALKVWEGPLTLGQYKADSLILRAHDITHYLNRTVMKHSYSNAYPNLDFCVNRIAGIIVNELGVKESLDPPVNILPFLHAYVQEGDARTTRTSLAGDSTVWQHLDDLAAKAGIDYTVIGRALHIWDTSRPALGRIRTLTEADFIGDTYIAEYGMETATQTFVTDGQGNYGSAGGVDDFYGEIDILATAFDENGNAVDQTDNDPTNDTIPIAEMTEQAVRNLKGRNPTPSALKVPDNSSFRLDRGVGLDVLIPGVYVPVSAKLAGRTLKQMMKLKEVVVTQDEKGESSQLTLTPASDSDEANTLTDDGS